MIIQLFQYDLLKRPEFLHLIDFASLQTAVDYIVWVYFRTLLSFIYL